MTGVSPLNANPLRAIFEVGAALVSSAVFEEVLAELVAKIGEAMDVSSCDLQTYVPERDACIYEAFWSVDGPTEDDRAYIGTVTNVRDRPDIRAILESRDLVEQHVDDTDLPAADLAEIVKWGYKSTLDVPLWAGGRVIGILGVQEARFVRRFTPAERDQFARLCELASIGIHNAGVVRRQQERSRHLDAYVEISHALATVREPAGVFAVIARSAAAAFGAPRVIVDEFDAGSDTLTPRAIHQEDHAAGYDTVGVPEPAATMERDRGLLTHPDPVIEQVSDPALVESVRAGLDEWGEKTCLSVPVVFGGEPIGLLMLIWTEQERLLTADELMLATGIAGQAAVALANARLRATAAGAGDPQDGST